MTIAFRLDLPHGRCVGVEIPATDEEVEAAGRAGLQTAERMLLARLSPSRRASWVAGRMALRTALVDLGLEGGPLLSTDRGGPTLPPGAAGSISHKRGLAVALAAPDRGDPRPSFHLGIDLEEDAPSRVDISRRVLTAGEAALVNGLPLSEEERHRQVRLRLSAKEALYKALDPYLLRYVSFKEAELRFSPDGRANVALFLPPEDGAFEAEVFWRTLESGGGAYFLTTARLCRPVTR